MIIEHKAHLLTAIHDIDVFCAASDLVKNILQPVVVISNTEADTIWGADVKGLTTTAGVEENATGKVICIYAGAFILVGVTETIPPCKSLFN